MVNSSPEKRVIKKCVGVEAQIEILRLYELPSSETDWQESKDGQTHKRKRFEACG